MLAKSKTEIELARTLVPPTRAWLALQMRDSRVRGLGVAIEWSVRAEEETTGIHARASFLESGMRMC